MILQSHEVRSKSNYGVVYYGIPGGGKSTLALSAPNPLMIDTDKGYHRIPVHCRKGAYTQPATYDELLADITPENIKVFETIIFDTGGTLINLMKPWAIKRDPKNGQKDGATLSQKGYGIIGMEFNRLLEYVLLQQQKNIIVIFHAKEEMDGDQKVFRLDAEGQSRDNVWKPMDLGGFIEAYRNDLVISFSPTDRFKAKGTHGIHGTIELPNVMNGAPNDFFTKLFESMRANLASESQIIEKYDKLMVVVREIVGQVTDSVSASTAMGQLATLEHVFNSKKESWALLVEQAKKSGLVYVHDAKEWRTA